MPAIRPPNLTLEQRIEQVKSDVLALIKDAAAREAAANPGVPQVVLEKQIMVRAGFCLCRAYDEVKKSA